MRKLLYFHAVWYKPCKFVEIVLISKPEKSLTLPLRRIAQPFPLGYNISITKIERTVYRDGKK